MKGKGTIEPIKPPLGTCRYSYVGRNHPLLWIIALVKKFKQSQAAIDWRGSVSLAVMPLNTI
ncbi:hypothetical protein PILCRDRAFT_820121 [Piloderma croceum F 1598]|uniref:Uncharacterized protein n=1 Tax=Piloderma croceum (strain F 1598) TaxID=765440 RepID=A0A0C3B959_PILCF|nr:hypothetical protein PILCRDRAFT_820121 [Piloderma croceum F 1598]